MHFFKIVTEVLAAQEANKPVRQKPVSSLEKFEAEKIKTNGTLYNPDDLTGAEQKVFFVCLNYGATILVF